jgi:hypothetical protein
VASPSTNQLSSDVCASNQIVNSRLGFKIQFADTWHGQGRSLLTFRDLQSLTALTGQRKWLQGKKNQVFCFAGHWSSVFCRHFCCCLKAAIMLFQKFSGNFYAYLYLFPLLHICAAPLTFSKKWMFPVCHAVDSRRCRKEAARATSS